jgi:hypothetical protein
MYNDWVLETEKLNKGKTLKVGDSVIDMGNRKGIVVKIIHGICVENHGVIYVWQSETTRYGDDNCEHYVDFGWQKCLRIL